MKKRLELIKKAKTVTPSHLQKRVQRDYAIVKRTQPAKPFAPRPSSSTKVSVADASSVTIPITAPLPDKKRIAHAPKLKSVVVPVNQPDQQIPINTAVIGQSKPSQSVSIAKITNSGVINVGTATTQRTFKKPLSQAFVVTVPPTYQEFSRRASPPPSVHPPVWATQTPSVHPPVWAAPVTPRPPVIDSGHLNLLVAYDQAKHAVSNATSRRGRQRALKRAMKNILHDSIIKRR